MNEESIFSSARFMRLILNCINNERRNILWYTLGLIAVLLFLPVSLSQLIKLYNWPIPLNLSRPGLYLTLAGIITSVTMMLKASAAFPELKHKAGATALLSLPASPLEKVLSRYLLYSIGLLLLSAVICAACIGILMIFVINPSTATWMKSERWWNIILSLLFFQGFYFAGAAYFKKNNFLKTSVTLFLINFVIGGAFSYFKFGKPIMMSSGGYGLDGGLPSFSLGMDMIIYLLCLVMVYFRIKELELDEI